MYEELDALLREHAQALEQLRRTQQRVRELEAAIDEEVRRLQVQQRQSHTCNDEAGFDVYA